MSELPDKRKGQSSQKQPDLAETKFIDTVADDIPNHSLGDDQEFFIPVHDFVRFTHDEVAIINHPAFQRLGKVYQLGQAYLVYRGATHKRLEHALGTVWVTQKIINALNASYRRALRNGMQKITRSDYAKPPSLLETRFTRLAALLHDIGHLPAGHTLEDELGLLEPHDANKRLDLVFDKTDWIKGVESERLGELIDRLYKKYIDPKEVTAAPRQILKKLISKDEKPSDKPFAGIRISVCRDIVGNTICADLLDYLHRDWNHIGKPRFFDRRLFEYMQIRYDQCDGVPKFVISYGQRSRPKRDAITSILDLLESRYNLGESVLFHPTKCAAAAMLERGIWELHSSIPRDEQIVWLKNLENKLLEFSDEQMISWLLEESIARECNSATSIFQGLLGRELYKSVEAIYQDGFGTADRELLQHHYLGKADEKTTSSPEVQREFAATRMAAIATLEREFNLERGSLVMYCPSQKMNSKIAQVKIIYDDSINTLNDWDVKKNENLAGGHCAAQMKRFESLWRIEVFLSRKALSTIEEKFKTQAGAYIELLRRAVRTFILGVSPTNDRNLLAESAAIAGALVNFDGSPYFGWKALPVSDQIAARNINSQDRYPLGLPHIRQLLVQK